MYQRILVPIDTSDSSSTVLQQAKRLASETHAKICLIKVIDITQFASGPDELLHELHIKDEERLLDERRASLQRFLAETSAQLKAAGIDVETRLVEKYGGKFAKTILDEAAQWQADLIMMGTHGRSGLMHLLLGSVAEEVVRHATVPVLLVRKSDGSEWG